MLAFTFVKTALLRTMFDGQAKQQEPTSTNKGEGEMKDLKRKTKVVVALLGGALVLCFLAHTYLVPAKCQEPVEVAKIMLKAPEEAEVGELVRFDLTGSVAQSFKWRMVPATVDFEIFCDGERTVFSARKPGTYMFIIACAYNGTVDIVTHTVTIVGIVPPDDVSPDVAKPDANADLDKWVVYWCSKGAQSQLEADKLAGSFDSVAAQIAAMVLRTPAEIIQATATANRTALGDSLPAWEPVLQSIRGELRNQADKGLLNTPAQHQKLWKTIAKGLRAYATLK